jgi:hypothetical protein
VAAVAAVLAFNLLHKSPNADPDTLCLLDRPLETHAIVIVDATDSFTRDQAAQLRASIEQERRSLPIFGKFTLLFVTAALPYEPEIIISICNPGSGSDVSPLFANPRQVEQTWREQFADPIDRAIDRLLAAPSANSSPILQTITAATWRHDFGAEVEHRRLRIISDLLQHGNEYTQYYLGDPWPRFAGTTLAKAVNAELTGVVVKVDYLHRTGSAAFQTQAQIDFWSRWFTEKGAAVVDISA